MTLRSFLFQLVAPLLATRVSGSPPPTPPNVHHSISHRAQLDTSVVFRALFHQTHDAVFLLDLTGKTLIANQQAADLLGYTQDELVGMTIDQVVDEAELSDASSRFQRLLAGEVLPVYERMFRRRDGTLIPVELNVALVRDVDGAPLYVQSMARDLLSRKAREQELHESRRFIERVTSTIPDLVYVYDLTLHLYVYVNQAAVRVLGYEAERLVQLSVDDVLELLHPDDREHLRRHVARYATARDGDMFELTFRIQTATGEWRWLYTRDTIFAQDDAGRPTQILGVSQDITDLRRSEAELEAKSALLQNVIDTVPDYIYVKDREGRLILNNAAHARSLGSAPADLVGRMTAELFPPDLSSAFATQDQQVIQSGQPLLDLEEITLGQHGERIWARTSKVPLRDEAGDVIGLVGVTVDISARKQVEAALRESEARYRTLAEHFPGLVLLFDRDLRHLIAGGAGLEALGLTRDLLEGKLLSESFPDWVVAGVEPHYRAALRGEKGVVTLPLSTLLFRMQYLPVCDAGGGVVAGLLVAQDITEQHQREEQLRRQNAYLNAFNQTMLSLIDRLDIDDLLGAILQRSAALLNTPHGFIDLIDPETMHAREYQSTGGFEDYAYVNQLGEGLVGQVWVTGNIINVDNYATWEHRIPGLADDGIRAIVGAPLKSDGQVVGVLGLGHFDADRKFNDDDIAFLARFAELASIALDNARLYSRAQRELEERKRVEGQLRISEARYRTVIENQTELICRYLPDNTLSFVNEALCVAVGKQADELLGHSFVPLVHEEDRAMVLSHVTGLSRDHPTVTYTHRMIVPSGDLRWTQWVDTAIFDEHGEIIEYQAVGRDVTEQKRAEDALEAEHRLLTAILSHTPALITVHDAAGRLVMFNRACEQLSGYTQAEVQGRYAWDFLVPGEDGERLKTVLERARLNGSPLANTNSWRLRDGSERLIEWANIAVADPEGNVDYIIATGLDITDRRQLEERNVELAVEREKVRLLSNFVRDISHDVKTPLAVLNTSLYLLERAREPEQIQSRVGVMQAQIARLGRLIEQLLTMSRLDANPELSMGTFDMDDLITDLITSPRFMSLQQDRRLTLNLHAGTAMAHGDAAHIALVLGNVIENAFQFTPVGGEVTISTRVKGAQIEVSVADSGSGIDAADLPYIFDRFYKADKARSDETGGAGLGLAIARRIMDLHDEVISVGARPEGGAVFCFSLPVASPSRGDDV